MTWVSTHIHARTHTYTHSLTHTPIYTHTHTHIHTHTKIHTHTPIYTHACTLTHTHTPIHTHTYTCTPIYTLTPIHAHPYTLTPIHAHTHPHTHTPIYAHTQIYTHTHTPIHTHTGTGISRHVQRHTETCGHALTYTCSHTYAHTPICAHTHTHPYTHTHWYKHLQTRAEMHGDMWTRTYACTLTHVGHLCAISALCRQAWWVGAGGFALQARVQSLTGSPGTSLQLEALQVTCSREGLGLCCFSAGNRSSAHWKKTGDSGPISLAWDPGSPTSPGKQRELCIYKTERASPRQDSPPCHWAPSCLPLLQLPVGTELCPGAAHGLGVPVPGREGDLQLLGAAKLGSHRGSCSVNSQIPQPSAQSQCPRHRSLIRNIAVNKEGRLPALTGPTL